jgi:hypothetical protein
MLQSGAMANIRAMIKITPLGTVKEKLLLSFIFSD